MCITLLPFIRLCVGIVRRFDCAGGCVRIFSLLLLVPLLSRFFPPFVRFECVLFLSFVIFIIFVAFLLLIDQSIS